MITTVEITIDSETGNLTVTKGGDGAPEQQAPSPSGIPIAPEEETAETEAPAGKQFTDIAAALKYAASLLTASRQSPDVARQEVMTSYNRVAGGKPQMMGGGM